jgi:hypothetical protein
MCLVKWVSACYCQIETLGIEMSPENKMVSFFRTFARQQPHLQLMLLPLTQNPTFFFNKK